MTVCFRPWLVMLHTLLVCLREMKYPPTHDIFCGDLKVSHVDLGAERACYVVSFRVHANLFAASTVTLRNSCQSQF